MICPNDTNGDGDCGQPACPYCGPQATHRTRLLADLDLVVRGSWAMRRAAGERIADRIDAIEDRIKVLERRTGDHRGAWDEKPCSSCGKHDCDHLVRILAEEKN